MRRLVPFLQPKGFRLKLFLVGCFATLAVGRVVNVIVPMQYKMLVDALSTVPPGERDRYYAWGAVLTFCFLRYLQGGAGILGTLQNLLWTPVWMANTRRVSVEMLQHLHSLSLQFHINRKTGEVLRVMDRGTSSIGSLLSAILFNIGPVFLDIGLAAGWFIYLFDIATGVIVLVTMGLYILLTIVITEWRTKFRREMNQLDSASRARAVDSLLNFETVKYYNNEAYEVDRFEKSFIEYQEADWKSTTSLSFLNTAQNTVITLGLTAGCLLCASRVVAGELTIGDFIMFITYILQLYQPLNFLGTYYRMIQQNFIDMESMFELLEENATVKDLPGAPNLSVKDGSVEFGKCLLKNVTFGYDERVTALRNVSFSVPAKTTTALVGPSGSGKSTIFRLIFRFYEPTSGRILVDGQDISRVTQASLRRAIGVVPQDTVLFNNGIGYNIGYGDVTKSFDEVVEAAKRAQIHDRILTFPDQYETKVGERGLRLSGGEKQRVAIARTLLKDPKIILLDEATSALDNTTEVLIQRSLQELTSRRTTLIIAHRLSTIIHADCILVLKEGKIRGKRLADLKRHKKEGLLGGVVEGLRGLVVGLEDGGVVDESVAKLETEGAGTYYHMWMREVEEEEQGKKEPAVALRRGNGAADVVDLDSRRGGGGGGRGGGRFH
ncbi:P-loop containing nucleoside triphosphate hydrolase protein [Zopfochytrium polystomum]|nr:P-loop containing nucleoside triphosphate hydrolase protein [Zopfochytrium polystomum]